MDNQQGNFDFGGSDSPQPPRYPDPPMFDERGQQPPPPQGTYPPPGGSSQQQGGYPPPQGSYPPPQGGYSPPQGNYAPPPQGGSDGGYPPQGGPGGYYPPQGPPNGPVPGRGKGIASLVLGILSLIFVWFGYSAILGFAMAIVGLILGVQARKEMPAGNNGIATGGFVCSIIGLVLNIIGFVACVVCVSCLGAGLGGLTDYYYY